MSTKAIFVSAIVCGILGCILFVVALSSTSWISGCMNYGDLMKNVGKMAGGLIPGMGGTPTASSTPSSMDTAGRDSNAGNSPDSDSGLDLGGALSNMGGGLGDMFNGLKLCISQGLFKINMNAGGMMDSTISMDVSTIPKAVIFGTVGICIAILCGACATIMLIMAAAGNIDSYEHKGKAANRTGIGMVLLIIACVAGVIGMASYTGGSEQEIHNPALLMMQLGSAFSKAFEQVSTGRGKRDLSDLANMGDLSNLNGIDTSGLDLDGMMKSFSSIFDFDMHYSYAFVLGWVAAVMLIVGAILSAIAKQKLINQPYMGSSNVRL